MNATIARAGAIAGWLSLVGIFGYHIGLTVLGLSWLLFLLGPIG
jgi:hypothetical protein